MSDRPGAPWSRSNDRNPLKGDMISLRRPVSRQVNRAGGSDDPKLIAEVTLAGTSMAVRARRRSTPMSARRQGEHRRRAM
jgi:hypothetical protein